MPILTHNYVPEQAESPSDAPHREVQDEPSIRDAIGEVDQLESSLRFLDRKNIKPDDSYFCGWRNGKYKNYSAYEVLKIIRQDLEGMLED